MTARPAPTRRWRSYSTDLLSGKETLAEPFSAFPSSRRVRDVRSARSRGPNGVSGAGSATPLVRAPGCVTASDIRCRFQVGVCRKRATMRGVRLVIGDGDGAIRWRQISPAMARGPQVAYTPPASPWTTSTASLISAGSTQSVITIGVSHRLLICHSVRFSPRT